MADVIVGTDSDTYTPAPGDVGKNLYCRVTATNAVGSATANSNTVGPVAAAAGATTFDPANKSVNVTLSGGNLTATLTSDARGGARSITTAASPDKKYFELTVGVVSVNAANVVGIANAANGVDAFPGSTLDGAGLALQGQVYINNSTVADTAFNLIAGNRLGVAINFATEQMWFRKNGGSWAPGSAPDPETNYEGMSFASTNAGPYYVLLSQITNLDACTINFGPTFVDTAPTGYGVF